MHIFIFLIIAFHLFTNSTYKLYYIWLHLYLMWEKSKNLIAIHIIKLIKYYLDRVWFYIIRWILKSNLTSQNKTHF